MAKNKRKIGAAQRDKVAIKLAVILKKKGVLSKNTKLHGGKYISRGVLKKVQEMQHVAKPSYVALKVTKDIARTAKAEGYQVVQGNRIIVPKEHDFIKRVKAGMVSGLKPVKGGFMSEVQMTFDGENAAQLIDWLDKGNLEALKLEHEHFAFRLSGSEGSPHGMSYRTFPTQKHLRDWLKYYNPSVSTTGFKLYRLHPEDALRFIVSRDNRDKLRKSRGRQDDKGNYQGRRTYAEKMRLLERNNPAKFARMVEERKARDKERYAKQQSDPVYREAARRRALESWNRRNKK